VSPADPASEIGLPPAPAHLAEKVNSAIGILCSFSSALVAYSGGVDSTLLAWLTHRLLGPERMHAVIADTPTLPRRELAAALKTAAAFAIPCSPIPTGELDDPDYARNPPERCYLCKHVLLAAFREAFGDAFDVLLCGTNADDAGQRRPGLRAEEETGVRRPLLEAGLGKEDIRQLSRLYGLPTWDRPAQSCLATRIPYGETVTREKLARIEAAEEVLHGADFEQVRVRHLGDRARIEVAAAELGRLADPALRARILRGVQQVGFRYVEIDPEPYRSGRLDETLAPHGDREEQE